MLLRLPRLAARALALLTLAASPATAAWPTYGGNPQHTALSPVPTQPLQAIKWSMPVDLQPQYSGSTLLIHYGSPLITEGNTVIVSVKTGVTDTFRVEARRGSDGLPLWTLNTDYRLPPYNWVPSLCGVITPRGRYYVPGAGGTLLWTDNLDFAGSHTANRVAFYGIANYNANPSAFAAGVRICTPLTSDSRGTVYFGFRTVNTNPLNITSGIAAVDAQGNGRFVTALAASGGLSSQVAMNCAPALSGDEKMLYVAVRGASSSPGRLLALRTADLSTHRALLLLDNVNATNARVPDEGTSSPMVAPDGRIYYGVLENPFGSNAARGWLLAIDSTTFTAATVPGAFGWDITPSLVPASAVTGYAGSSSYLLMTKYNYYAGLGDGVNKLAVLDPNDTQIDTHVGATVWKAVRLINGVTPDPQGPSYPNAVAEWCINTSAVDPYTRSVLAGSEDGVLYRWDLGTNTFSESVVLTPGIGEAYTPTVTGPDGKVYAINNATLFAVGASSAGVPPRPQIPQIGLALASANPTSGATRIRFTLPQATRVELEVLDLAGRRVATLWQGDAAAGDHDAAWDGRDASGAPVRAGVHLVRLKAGTATRTLKFVIAR